VTKINQGEFRAQGDKKKETRVLNHEKKAYSEDAKKRGT